jgi:hypothetical protein
VGCDLLRQLHSRPSHRRSGRWVRTTTLLPRRKEDPKDRLFPITMIMWPNQLYDRLHDASTIPHIVVGPCQTGAKRRGIGRLSYRNIW